MTTAICRMTLLASVFTLLSAPVFAQTDNTEARRHLVRGLAAIEMAKNNEELGEAAEEFRKATEIAPQMAAAWYNLGAVQSKMGQAREGIASYQRYLALAPGAQDAQRVRDEIVKLEYRMEKTEQFKALGGQWIDTERNAYGVYVEENKLIVKGSHPRSRGDFDYKDVMLIDWGGIGGLGAEQLTIRLERRGSKLVGSWEMPSGKIYPSDICTVPAEKGDVEGEMNAANSRMALRLMRARYRVVQVDPPLFGSKTCEEVSITETRPVEMVFLGPLPRGDVRFTKINSSGTFTMQNVEKGSPEEAAGLLKGDEIIAIDGTEVRQMGTEGDKLMKRRGEPGSTVQLLIKRADKTLTVTLRRSEM